ncbi:MAG: potassium channel family protein [Fervidobacterium sp.]
MDKEKNIWLRELNENILLKRILISISGIFLVFSAGTIYYWLIEDYTFTEAMFFTAITLSTVGYGIPKDLSLHGKLFTILLILIGLSFVLYSISYITATLVEGEIAKIFKNKNIERRIRKMKRHVIVVGVGNLGTQVIHQLLRYENKVVAIDKNSENTNIKGLEKEGKVLFITGDATSEDTLLKAGIKEARTLITTLPDDALNIFVALTAKNLNSNIYVVSNITNISNLTKFIYAGVDHPIATAEISGIKMVETVVSKKAKEDVVDVLSIRDKRFRIEIIETFGTPLSGKRIEDLQLKEKYNILVVAIMKDGEFLLGPSKGYLIGDNDKLVIFGEVTGIEEFRKKLLHSNEEY